MHIENTDQISKKKLFHRKTSHLSLMQARIDWTYQSKAICRWYMLWKSQDSPHQQIADKATKALL
jgi:hypothetical protein